MSQSHIILVRHGEASAGWNMHPDPGLSVQGRGQARQRGGCRHADPHESSERDAPERGEDPEGDLCGREIRAVLAAAGEGLR